MPNKFFGIWCSHLEPTAGPRESDGCFAAIDYGYPNRLMVLHTDKPIQPFDAYTTDAAESSTAATPVIRMTRDTSDGKFTIEYCGNLLTPPRPCKLGSIRGTFTRTSRGSKPVTDSGVWTSDMPPPFAGSID